MQNLIIISGTPHKFIDPFTGYREFSLKLSISRLRGQMAIEKNLMEFSTHLESETFFVDKFGGLIWSSISHVV